MIDVEGFLATYHEVDDPHPFYDQLRAHGRMAWVDSLDRWLVTGHRQAMFMLRHEDASNDRRNGDGYELPPGLDRPPGGMAAMDQPDHTRLRSLVQQAFTPRLVDRLRPRIEELTDKLLVDAAAQADAEIDLMRDLAYPLPSTILAELLGIPAQEQDRFGRWATTFMDGFDPVSHRFLSEEAAVAHADLQRFLVEVIEERRRRPRPDLISGLIEAEERGDRLTADELLEMCMLLTVAGLETTANLIGNGINALTAHPDEMARLRADPGLIDSAVEELLRFDPPIQVSGRVACRDIDVDGQIWRKGQVAGIMLAAANRDPEVFVQPHRLDLVRRPNNHLGFGRGIHFCLGASLARLEGSIALLALVTRFPDLHRVGEAKRRTNVHVRGFVSMPVALR
jgi:pimeloyl-[acyl-carrier protein] synthase